MAKKTILHIPHSSTEIPDLTGYLVSNNELEKEKLLLTDWYTDDLFSLPDSVRVIANFSRVFCDVERFANDEDEVMAGVGMGVTYTATDDGNRLREVSSELKAKILRDYYNPHHLKLNAAVAEELSTSGEALIIDCHSFSNEPFKRDINQDTPRPDFCIGIDDYHTPRRLYKLAAIGLKMLGYNVKLNTPYSGSIVPTKFYRKNKRVLSIMIEVNRDLYLIPGTNLKSEGYDKLKSNIQGLLKFISSNYDNK
ncbi:N-formylglutamate amidohydrolase [Mucilaginibacter ginsenosidivorax]|uniref:N-formylglutamate amidohydrolase n=1 Tax=Mucilaginibacter ginsenosidivorax TaxID=862126 RepID=A0A5B8WCM9_9SPHI|nr:N-formylglutamate amidohydrolase [Mucilaginibacter ginsenosidivorax]QEC79708.1 N-formylglutamate amidohydrolase [Mucilaginibacter ginsenosidivorax]